MNDDKPEESKEVKEKFTAPYEDPKVYFMKVLLKNLPATNSKSEKCEELFNLLITLIKSSPTLFNCEDPYATENQNEEIDVANIFSANSVLSS